MNCCSSFARRLIISGGSSNTRTLTLRRFASLPENGGSRKKSFGDQLLRKETTTFDFNGTRFSIQSVVQDTQPSGSSLGTVIALHGSPGSHKDFKYVSPLLQAKGIRFIGVNFPGYGLTEGHPQFNQDNMERVAYVQALCDQLGLHKNLIFMGHSRGTENALKMAALNPGKTVGIVQANFLGARPHRGIRPTWFLPAVTYLWDLGWSRPVLGPLMFFVYNKIVKIKVKSADEAAWAVSSIRAKKLELHTQKDFVAKLNDSGIKSLLLYSGQDPLVEPEISIEFAALFVGNKTYSFETKTEEEEITKTVCGELESGTRSVSVFFKNDDHFMQKHRAGLIADAAESMLKSTQNGF